MPQSPKKLHSITWKQKDIRVQSNFFLKKKKKTKIHLGNQHCDVVMTTLPEVLAAHCHFSRKYWWRMHLGGLGVHQGEGAWEQEGWAQSGEVPGASSSSPGKQWRETAADSHDAVGLWGRPTAAAKGRETLK